MHSVYTALPRTSMPSRNLMLCSRLRARYPSSTWFTAHTSPQFCAIRNHSLLLLPWPAFSRHLSDRHYCPMMGTYVYASLSVYRCAR